MTTTLLSSLKAIARPEIVKSPVLAKRMKLIERLEEQLAMVNAKLANQPFSFFREKTVTDPTTGDKHIKQIPRKVRQWFFDDANHFYFEVRFAGKTFEVESGKPTIDVGALSNLPALIALLIQAVEKGELDLFLRSTDSNDSSEQINNLDSDTVQTSTKTKTARKS